MGLSLVTPPSSEALDLLRAKRHLRVDGNLEDADIDKLISAAVDFVEEDTGRQIMPATWQATFDRFPHGRWPLELPRPPLLSVSEVTYLDSDGVEQTWDAAEYQVYAPAGPFARNGHVQPIPNERYPTTRRATNAVTVEFEAGYADVEQVPQVAVAAIQIVLADLFEHREGHVVGETVSANPVLDRLLNRLRLPVFA